MSHDQKIYEYRDFTDDFVESARQDAKLPDGFRWIHNCLLYSMCSAVLYGIAFIFAVVYCKLVLRITVKNKKVLRECRNQGCFLYGNHTQPVGDVFAPGLYSFPQRIVVMAGAANLGIPFLGRLLPMMGGLFVPDSVGQMKEFMEAVQHWLDKKRRIVIYPEAHVWPYCTFIRPFPETSFSYPVRMHAPAYCMTTTYQKRRFGKKPKITTYIDGPFYSEEGMSRRAQQKELHDRIYACMKERSSANTYEYIHYREKSQ